MSAGLKMKLKNFLGYFGNWVFAADGNRDEALNEFERTVDRVEGVKLCNLFQTDAVDIRTSEDIINLREELWQACWWHLYLPETQGRKVEKVTSEEFFPHDLERVFQEISFDKVLLLVGYRAEGKDENLVCSVREIRIHPHLL